MPCKIPKQHRRPAQITGTCIIRVNAEQYQSILDISDETGRSIRDVSTRLIEYALEHVEITEEP